MPRWPGFRWSITSDNAACVIKHASSPSGAAHFLKVINVNQQPLVSIVIPAFNPRYFNEALKSALDQTYPNLEILIGDDSEGSAIEAMVEVASGRLPGRVHYRRNPRRLGLAANVLALLEAAQGELVKVLCDDDRLLARCVEQQAAAFQHAEVKVSLAQRVFCDAGDFVLPQRLQNVAFANTDSMFKGSDVLAILAGSPVNFLGNFSSALFYRREAAEILKVLINQEQQFEALLDLVLFVCLMRHGEVAVMRSAAIIERLHPERLSLDDSVKASTQQEWGGSRRCSRPAVEMHQLLPAGCALLKWRECLKCLGSGRNCACCAPCRLGSVASMAGLVATATVMKLFTANGCRTGS